MKGKMYYEKRRNQKCNYGCIEKRKSTFRMESWSYPLDNIEDEEVTEKNLLNGAENWKQYSYGGCALIYDKDICHRLCTPSEIKKTKDGERRPNNHENWLDTQARALYQAVRLIIKIKRAIEK